MRFLPNRCAKDIELIKSSIIMSGDACLLSENALISHNGLPGYFLLRV